MHHKGGGDYRRDEIDERNGEQARDHDPAEEDASPKPAAHRSSPSSIEPSERDNLKILPAEKIPVHHQKEKEIYPGEQEIDRQRQEVEHERQPGQPQHAFAKFR